MKKQVGTINKDFSTKDSMTVSWKISPVELKDTFRSPSFKVDEEDYELHFEFDPKDLIETFFTIHCILDKGDFGDFKDLEFTSFSFYGTEQIRIFKTKPDIVFKKVTLAYNKQISSMNKINEFKLEIVIKEKAEGNQTNNSSYSYNSNYVDRTETGYNGLKNQGATCYMNSMLQSLFHTPAFRRLVYNMPTTGTEDVNTSIPLNLQRLFAKMQFSKSACSTKDLTKSFGWESSDVYQQHDVHEFCRVLLDNLEMKLKNTPFENDISNIFRGKYRNYIRGVTVQFQTYKEEQFYDLSLSVKGVPNLQKSFEEYIKPQILDGDNQYQTEEHGKIDVSMGTEFLEFPSVLHLHLNRFEYDYTYNRIVKVGDKFEFPKEIDLSPFLAKDANCEKSNLYQLFGVLVHSGGVGSGHYYAFLRTTTEPQWFEFNDSNVYRATENKSIDDNFGGSQTSSYSSSSYSSSTYTYGNYNNYSWNRSYCGYFLIYVRSDDAHRIFAPINKESVPLHIQDWVENAPEETYNYYGSGNNSSSPKDINFYSEDSLITNNIQSKTGYINESLKKTVKLPGTTKYSELYEEASKLYGIDVKDIRIWQLSYYYHAPNIFIKNDTFSTISSHYSTDYYVHVAQTSSIMASNDINTLFVCIKFFFPDAKLPMQYVGMAEIDKKKTYSDIIPIVNKMMGFPDGTELEIYEETIGPSVHRLTSTLSIQYSSISSGHVFIFQIPPNSPIPHMTFVLREPHELSESKHVSSDQDTEPNVTPEVRLFSYTNFTDHNKKVSIENYYSRKKKCIFASLRDYKTSELLCDISFPSDIQLADMKKFIINSLTLQYDPFKDAMQIYKQDYNGDYPSSFPLNSNYSLSYDFQVEKKYTLYLLLVNGITESELDRMVKPTIQFSEDSIKVSRMTRMFLSKNSKVSQLIQQFAKEFNIDTSQKLRVLKIDRNSIVNEMNPSEELPYYLSNVRIEVIPQDQIDNPNLVRVAFLEVDNYSYAKTVGDPFLFVFNPEETLLEMKKRLQGVLNADEGFFKYRKVFFAGNYPSVNQSDFMKDDTIVGKQYDAKKSFDTPTLYILNQNKKTSKSTIDNSIKIYN